MVDLPTVAPTEIIDILMDEDSPFICRRKMDKSAYEIVENTSPEWRTLIPNDGWVNHGDFPNAAVAWNTHANLIAQWKWRRVIAALANNTDGGE
jgi:hypothetical protein